MKTIEEIKKEALENHIPIMEDEGMDFLCAFIREHNIRKILEAGSAVGYSAIRMAMTDPEIRIVTIEKDADRALLARENIEASGYSNQIVSLCQDARKHQTGELYDLLLIDAAKTANEKIFQALSPYVRQGGYIVSDDIYFHGFPEHPEIIRSKHFRELAAEVKKYRETREKDPLYKTEYYAVGDGILISEKL
ncbi:MAG: class I SAM-dependent methyltransferase [Erysipelotrichales bacterium]|nr:class I SAM-dependent methyltransferase [Erysipelotrichales bacterium]